MGNRSVRAWVVGGMVVVMVAALVCGCGGKPKPNLVLGPERTMMSNGQPIPDFEQAMVTEGRAWLESLSADDVKKMDQQGKLTFTMAQLKTSAPAHAAAIEKYCQDRVAGLEQKAQAKGFSLNASLTPAGVSLTGADVDQSGAPLPASPGQYFLVLQVAESPGRDLRVQLSGPAPAK